MKRVASLLFLSILVSSVFPVSAIAYTYERPTFDRPSFDSMVSERFSFNRIVVQESSYSNSTEEEAPVINEDIHVVVIEDQQQQDIYETVSEEAPLTTKKLTLYELGLLQIAAHDLFNVDRDTEIDHENGKLDLSTILDHGDDYIAIGGEARNRENIILFTVAKKYGELYERYLRQRNTPEEAREKVVWRYHYELGDVYEKLFGELMPAAKDGEVTMTENLALRTIHDLLPGHVKMNGQMFETIDPSLIGKTLSWIEMKAETDPLDGEFNDVFRDVIIVIPPDTILTIDLFERDSSLASQFGTDFTFEHFMEELSDGRYNTDDDVMILIRSLFAKGLNF